MHPLDAATKLETAGDKFTGATSDAYWNFTGPFGGATAATLLNAAMLHPKRQNFPLAMTINYCAPVAKGAFDIQVAEKRTNRSTQHFTVEMTQGRYRLAISGVCLAVAALLYFVIARTRLGMMIRAGSTNREMVQSLGIDIKFLYRVVFAAGVALAVLAGMIAAPVSSVYPNMGAQVLIVCFVVVVIGGIGSVRGAFLAAILVGIVDTFGKVLFPQAAGVLVYLLMAAILLWKPEGLFRQG